MAERSRNAERWLRLTLRLDPAAVEVVVGDLWSLGTLGLEERQDGEEVVVEAFFPDSFGPKTVAGRALLGALESRVGVEVEALSAVAELDWLAEYRRLARPFLLGRLFVVDPREPGSVRTSSRGRILLRLPARRAFGTGSHASTRLVIEFLEGRRVSGSKVLDVGAGTGILGFAALHLGAASVVAVEVDPVAVRMAAENQRLNNLVFPLVAGGIDALGGAARFDLALVNVIPSQVVSDLDRLAALIELGGTAIFSGILSDSGQGFFEELRRVGFSSLDRRRSGAWEAWVMERRET